MTIDISNNDPRISYSVAQGVTQTSFAIPFEFFDDSDVNVYVDGTLKTITTDYTITGGAGSTGTLNISVTGGAGGSTVVLTRDITIERTTDFTAGADINRAALNTQLDTLTGIAADIKDATTLALRYNDQTVGVSTEMPVIDTLKGNVLAFNITTGAPEAGPSISEVSSAQTYATNAATSETNAAASASSASTSATNAATSATNASTSATAAAASETAAGASEAAAATSETNAASSASSASTSASAAASSASAASTSETNAASSASAAATSETNAQSAQTAAESARDATLAAYDSFDDRYLGAKSSDPTLDNDGNALIAGALYFNTTDEEMKLYTGSAWVAAYVSGSGFLASSGGTMTGDLSFGDNNKAIFGAGSDLQIYHEGSNSFIRDLGTGQLIIDTNGSTVDIKGSSPTEYMARFIKDGAVSLYYDNAQKLATTSTGVDVTGTITFDGGTTSADLNFGDNDKAVFGAGSDLQIYHDGSNSYIDEDGAGSLYVRAYTGVNIQSKLNNSDMITATHAGAVNLYHNGSQKLATTSTGISVTGTALATTDTDTSNTGSVTLDFAANQNFILTLTGNVTLANPTTEQVGQSGFIVFIQDGTGGRTVSLGTDYETAGGAGLTLSSAASATDIVPYIVAASGRILLGTPQLAFS